MRTQLTTLVLAITLSVMPNQVLAQRNRITARIDSRNRVTLRGHLHPRALPQDDQGPVAASMTLPYVTLVLKRSADQETALAQLLANQQNPASPDYHHWLTPEQYADRFGVSQDDVNTVESWLRDQSLNVVSVARGRNWIAFSGNVSQIESAFGTKIHHFQVDGETHFANTTEPSIPAAFVDVVRAVHGLNDFRFKSNARPDFTSTRGSHNLAPDDIATIYNVRSLYNAGIDGSGQKMVVVGQTGINLTDIQQFRSTYGLPANDPQLILVPNSKDPGIIKAEMVEADLDIELSGAVARNATILYVYSDDVSNSAQYAIDQNLAPVLSMSYGQCEAQTSKADAVALQTSAQQANAQGITWFAASGDSGATDCDGSGARTTGTLSVDLPAGLPEVTGVGGTTFSDSGGTFWATVNSLGGGSATSYIPETAWNDTTTRNLAASGGGASIYFPKPSWQTGTGVPDNGARNVPDVAFAASASHDGFLIYNAGSLSVVGGTSAGAPSFAGIATLLNHYLTSTNAQPSAGLGNMNPRLYGLAQASPSVFHDITSGDNVVDVVCSRARNCTPGAVGYNTGTGYDQVTGLGSVDAYALVTSWNATGPVVSRSEAAMTVLSDSSSLPGSGNAVLTATVTTANGGTPSGTVGFYLNGALLGTAPLAGSGGAAVATLSVTGTQLAAGTDAISAQYSGDSAYNSTAASVTLTVVSSDGPLSISGLANAASFRQAYTPGMILSVFGSQLAPSAQTSGTIPLPTQIGGVSAAVNGVAAPLYYVSPGQLNLQIPYQTPVNSTATLTINNNGQSVSKSFAVTAAAPGVFVDNNGAPSPNAGGARGQTITMFITGAGAVSPAVATGSSPPTGTAAADLPKPSQPVTVTVGGVPAAVQFAGIPAGLVGVTQINYQIPAGAATGAQPVVVTVGAIASQPATLTVTP